MARGLAKLRRRLTAGDKTSDEGPLASPTSGEKIEMLKESSTVKRVQFGETSFSQDYETEDDDEYAKFFFILFKVLQYFIAWIHFYKRKRHYKVKSTYLKAPSTDNW